MISVLERLALQMLCTEDNSYTPNVFFLADAVTDPNLTNRSGVGTFPGPQTNNTSRPPTPLQPFSISR